MGLSRVVLGPSWKFRKLSWGVLGGLLGCIGASEARNGEDAKTMQKPKGRHCFWPLWAFLGVLWGLVLGLLGVSWGTMGAFWLGKVEKGGKTPSPTRRQCPGGIRDQSMAFVKAHRGLSGASGTPRETQEGPRIALSGPQDGPNVASNLTEN